MQHQHFIKDIKIQRELEIAWLNLFRLYSISQMKNRISKFYKTYLITTSYVTNNQLEGMQKAFKSAIEIMCNHKVSNIFSVEPANHIPFSLLQTVISNKFQ